MELLLSKHQSKKNGEQIHKDNLNPIIDEKNTPEKNASLTQPS